MRTTSDAMGVRGDSAADLGAAVTGSSALSKKLGRIQASRLYSVPGHIPSTGNRPDCGKVIKM